MKKERLKKILQIVGRIITVLSLVFVFVAIYRLGFDFSSIESVPEFILILGLASSVMCASMYLMGVAWKNWLDFFSGKKNSTREVVCVYTKANIGKYLPGNVMHYVERNLFAGKIGISQKKIAACSVVEIIGQAGVALLFGLIFSFRQLQTVLSQLVDRAFVAIVSGIMLVFAVILVVFRKKIVPMLREYWTKDFLSVALKSLLIYAVVLIVSGLLMVVVYRYMGGTVTKDKAMLIVSSYIIAWVLGFVIPGAPGGIGVREFVLTVLLSSALGQELTLSVSVIHRLITIVGDFMAYMVRGFVERKRTSEE